MEKEKKAKLVAKILKGPPYDIENMEELMHFFGSMCPDEDFSSAADKFALAENRLFTIKVKEGKGMRSPEEYVKSGDHLPGFLKDFHDSKDFFKAMQKKQGVAKINGKEISWVDGMCYVIDHFLWFVAQHGYTLQRSRAKVNFKKLEEDVEH